MTFETKQRCFPFLDVAILFSISRKTQKPTKEQMKSLVDFMERHPELENDLCDSSDSLWKVLQSLLHNLKGANKEIRGWQRVIF